MESPTRTWGVIGTALGKAARGIPCDPGVSSDGAEEVVDDEVGSLAPWDVAGSALVFLVLLRFRVRAPAGDIDLGRLV